MSVFSSRKSSTPSSILKKTNLRSRLNQITTNTPTKVRFVLPHSKKVESILKDYINNHIVKEYENLVCLIRDAELLEVDIINLLKEATRCISLLNQDLRLFVEALLAIRWADRSGRIVSKYQSFIVNLVSAHNYHAKVVMDQLVSQFLPSATDGEWPDGVPNDVDCQKCANIHTLLNLLLEIVPMCKSILLQSLILHFPYLKKSAHIHEYYLHNLLWILDYQPSMKSDILHLIFSKLIILDVHAPKHKIQEAEEMDVDEIFPMDDDAKSVKTIEQNVCELAHTLDICLDKIFNYIISECYDIESGQLNWDNTKTIYLGMLGIFDELIIKTYNLHHVQFVMFLICNFKTSMTEAFLNHLWTKACNLNVAPVLRETAVNYMASLIARSNQIPLEMIKGSLQQMAEWIHSYISVQDGLECVNSDVKIHSVFYTVCQALFYIVAFRHRDLVKSKKNMTFLANLNMSKMVTSRLNPLRVCQDAVVKNFAAVTRKYQLAYCYSIIEHNSRNTIPTIYQNDKGSTILSRNTLNECFPFDPYILKRSSEKIESYYKNYQELSDVDYVVDKVEAVEYDDFLEHSSTYDQFSYSTSPGFKYKT